MATQLGLVALERNERYETELPISQDELDKRVQKDLADGKDRGQQRPAPKLRESELAGPGEDVPPTRE